MAFGVPVQDHLSDDAEGGCDPDGPEQHHRYRDDPPLLPGGRDISVSDRPEGLDHEVERVGGAHVAGPHGDDSGTDDEGGHVRDHHP